MTHSPSVNDPLKALLLSQETSVPAHDLNFTLDVMKRVEKRRLIEGLCVLGAVFVFVSALLFIVMPYVTPALVGLAPAVTVPLGTVAAVLLCLMGMEQTRRILPGFGLAL